MPHSRKIFLPLSKSLCIRRLVYDFLNDDRLTPLAPEMPEDVRVVHQCLAEISKAKEGASVADMPWRIDVRDCGAAYRFLMAVLAVTPGQWLLTGTPRLLQRPIDELVQVLRSIGAEIHPCRDRARPVSTNENGGGWQIHGKPLHASELTIDCTRSGQFATALLLIDESIGLKKLHVLPENPASAAYIAMTKAVISGEADLAPQRMGDWSAAVYWYARLLLSCQNWKKRQETLTSEENFPASIKLMCLDLNSVQSDAVLARWFENWGIVSRQEEDGVVISYHGMKDEPETVELDMSQNLDLVPVLACMACLWPKKVVFNGVANLKYKESDRLKVIQEQLSPFAKIEIKSYNGIPDNQLVIGPIDTHSSYSNSSYGFSFDAHNDHRFVMGFSLFALYGKVQIKGFDCVRKSYPNFKAEGVVAGTDVVG